MGSVPALDLRWGSGPDAATLVDLLYAELDDFDPLAIHDHETADGWRVFFRNVPQRDAAASALHTALGPRGLSIDPIDIDDDNWAKRSQEALRAVRVGRLVVAPPWATVNTDTLATDNTDTRATDATNTRATDNTDTRATDATNTRATDNTDTRATDNTDNTDIQIVIEPSTGFGTGHHETTRLCLELLQESDVTGRRVLDVGTGSGVLAIAAAKLGASTVVAFDEDPQALENARENVARNQVASNVTVRELDLGAPAFTLQPAAIVLANLTSGVLLKYARRLQSLVDEGGALLMSGFAPEDLAELVAAFGASAVHSRVDGAWAAAVLRFNDSPRES